MDWDAAWKWLVAPSGLLAAFAAWLFRRRKAPPVGVSDTSSWLSRRLAVEKNLMRCQQERTEDQTSFTRQLSTLTRHNEDLMTALQQATDAMEIVDRAKRRGTLTPSSPAPENSPPASPRGPTTPSG